MEEYFIPAEQQNDISHPERAMESLRRGEDHGSTTQTSMALRFHPALSQQVQVAGG